MRPRRPRRRVLVAAAVAAVAVAALGALAFVADDGGSAFVGVVAVVVTTALAVGLAPDATRRLLGLAPADATAARRRLLDRVAADLAALERQGTPQQRRADLTMGELVYVPSRRPREATVSGIGAVYASTTGRMVILGEPGAGKSTAAQGLVADLLARARADEGAPVPFLASLASWVDDRSRPAGGSIPLEDWLTTRLVDGAALSESEARELLARVVPVLDGLDEVSPADREACAREISRFVEAYPAAPIVVCCRSAEFEALPERVFGSLPRFEIRALTAADLAAHLSRLDAKHWAGVVAEVEREGSPLAPALATPLMVTVVTDTWGEADPAPLVATATAATSVEELRQALWGQWVARAERRADPATVALARGLAATAAQTGAAEIRFVALGSPATRWAWFMVWAAVAGALSVLSGYPGIALAAFPMHVVEAADYVTNRVTRPGHLRTAVFVVALVLVVAVVGPGVWAIPEIGAIGIPIAFGLGALAAWGPLPLLPLRQRAAARDPLAAWRESLAMGLGAILVPATVSVVVLDFPWAPAAGIPLGLSAFLGLDYAGHHLLARTVLRLRTRSGPLPARVERLVAAGVLRRTSGAHRFFHLELQRHLSEAAGPRDPIALENLGIDALFQQAYEHDPSAPHEELALWDRVLRRDPHNYAATMNRAIALRAVRRLDDALASCRVAGLLDPKGARPPLLASAILREQAKHGDAILMAERALTVEPTSVPAHVERGEALRALGRRDESLVAFDAAYALDPDNAAALRGRAESLRQLGRVAEAVVAFDRALVADPDSAFALYGRAQARLATADVDGALEDAVRVRTLVGGADEEVDALVARIEARRSGDPRGLAEAPGGD